MPSKKLTLASLTAQIPTDEAAYSWLEVVRWPDGPVCPHCGSIDHAYHLKPRNGGRKTRTGAVTYRSLWKCGDCRKQFSVTVGTVMERSKISVRKWVMAFHMLSAAKNGMSSRELARQLDITPEAGWFMSQRIRYAFSPVTSQAYLEGTVEADEAYIGGKHKGKRGRGASGKTPIVTLVERGGEAKSQVVEPITAKNLHDTLRSQIHPEAHLMTDSFPAYKWAGLGFASHQTVDHGNNEYVRGNAHTNTVEGFFSQLKRSLDGTHHWVSKKHLHRYLAEFDYRYNTRDLQDGERTVRGIRKAAGKRLMYKDSTHSDEA